MTEQFISARSLLTNVKIGGVIVRFFLIYDKFFYYFTSNTWLFLQKYLLLSRLNIRAHTLYNNLARTHMQQNNTKT